MRPVRTIVMWLAQGAIALLIGLSIVGAFRGDAKARALFNSVPLVVFWMGLAVLLAAGFVVYPRLLRRPAGLAMHMGVLLVLGGAMWGSERAHDLRRAWFGSEKISKGYMVIQEGTRERRVVDASMRRVLAELPFDLALRDFWIEYYELPNRPWHLVAVVSVRGPDGRVTTGHQQEIAWAVGQDAPVPFTPARVTVLAYLPHARPTYAEGAEPAVRLTDAGGETVMLPARVGAEVRLQDPPLTVRVVRVFTCLKVRRTAAGLEPYEAAGEGINPAVELAFERPDGSRETRYALALAPGHGWRKGDPEFRYVFPEPTGARPDPESPVPAMHLRVSADGREMTAWLLPQRDETYVRLDLGPVVPPTLHAEEGTPKTPGATEEPPRASLEAEAGEADAHEEAHAPPDAPAPALFLVRPTGPIEDYFSDVAVLDGGEVVKEKVIEVNHPLHWGGYHFYQADYDHEAGRYTVLQVVSDTGLPAVGLGMVLVVGGAFWRFWVEGVVGHVRQRRGRAGEGGEPDRPHA